MRSRDEIITWEERAAILEYRCKISRAEAEERASAGAVREPPLREPTQQELF